MGELLPPTLFILLQGWHQHSYYQHHGSQGTKVRGNTQQERKQSSWSSYSGQMPSAVKNHRPRSAYWGEAEVVAVVTSAWHLFWVLQGKHQNHLQDCETRLLGSNPNFQFRRSKVRSQILHFKQFLRWSSRCRSEEHTLGTAGMHISGSVYFWLLTLFHSLFSTILLLLYFFSIIPSLASFRKNRKQEWMLALS